MDRLSRREWLAGCAGFPLFGAGTGREYPQRSSDVSAQFAAARGVQVTQITDSAHGNQLSYYDIPCYAPSTERMVYNTVVTAPAGKAKKGKVTWGVVSCRKDGSNAQLLATRVPPTTSTARLDMSQDGKLVTYARCNDEGETGWDIYVLWMGDGAKAREFRITRMRTPVALTPKVKTSPPSWDQKVEKYLCAFSIDGDVHLVYHDGTSPEGTNAPVVARLTDLVEFPERRKGDTSFHRIRLNPVLPHLLYYRRNGVKDNWVVNLREKPATSRRVTDYSASIHATWSADGRILAGSMHGPWIEWSVANQRGELTAEFAKREIGPFGRDGQPGIFYGCYSGDNRWLAVATRYDQEPGGSLWLMNRETGKAAYLCKARYFGPNTEGQPRMGFVDEGRALVFSSDNSHGLREPGPPQIFLVRPLPRV